jgi:hypothetical protein
MRNAPIALERPPSARCRLFRTRQGYRWAGWAVAASFYLFDVFLRLTVDVVTSKVRTPLRTQPDFQRPYTGVLSLKSSISTRTYIYLSPGE